MIRVDLLRVGAKRGGDCSGWEAGTSGGTSGGKSDGISSGRSMDGRRFSDVVDSVMSFMSPFTSSPGAGT